MAVTLTPKNPTKPAASEGQLIVAPGSAIMAPRSTQIVQFASPQSAPQTADFDLHTAPFPVAIKRTALSIMFENRDFIADAVMPRVPSGQRFSWRRYRIGETYRRQNTRIGRTSKANEVEFGYDEIESRTEDFGLEVPIPQDDIDNARDAGAGYDPVNAAIRRATNYVMLEREIRVAAMVTDTANFARNTDLNAGSRFDDYASSTSNPISTISAALRSMLVRANTMVLSEDVFDTIVRHPQVVRAFNGNDGGSGIATIDFLKSLFRLQNIHIGSAWVDNVSADLPTSLSVANISRIWGRSVALVRLDPTANLNEGMTWGMTAQWKSRVTNVRYDPDIGLEGGQRVKVGEHVKEVVPARECGHIIQNAIAP